VLAEKRLVGGSLKQQPEPAMMTLRPEAQCPGRVWMLKVSRLFGCGGFPSSPKKEFDVGTRLTRGALSLSVH
jgi:hypothetical protein